MNGDGAIRSAGGLFTRFFREHYDDVRRYALRRLGPDAADDIAAETFSVAWRRFDVVPEEPLPWLYGVARNLTRARLRETRRDGRFSARSQDVDPLDPGATDPHGTVADRESALRALEQLSETDRELIMLLAWEGLELQEAARVLGCSTPTARVRLYRARRRIEHLMDIPVPDRTTRRVTVPPIPAPAALKEKS